ncbi:MAG TPA: transglutaminase-like cysteine peptidase [Ideonella sp.]|nr:transglutaminase-like cysteine peptidase [Ideonella sp.]
MPCTPHPATARLPGGGRCASRLRAALRRALARRFAGAARPASRLLRAALLVGLGLSLTVQAWDPERIVQAAVRHGETAVQGARALRLALAALAGQDDLVQIAGVNEFFNRRLLFREDADNWGQADYWASPLESLQRGMADCEDYAIAKYFTLTSMGVPHRKLRLVYVRAVMGGPGGAVQAHMVLAYYRSPEAEPYVLDNLITELRPAGRRQDLTPVFSFNAEGIWEGVGSVAVAGSATERLSLWRDVLARSRQDGFQ